MRDITKIILVAAMSQMPVFAKDIYIKTMSVSKKYSDAEIAKLKDAHYDVYTQDYKNLTRIYIGPFKDMKSARTSLKKVKRDVAKDAFITKVETPKPKKEIIKETPKPKIEQPPAPVPAPTPQDVKPEPVMQYTQPVIQQPSVVEQQPVVEAPVVEAPVVEQKAVVEPPVVEQQPVVEAPVVEQQSVKEEPKAQEEPQVQEETKTQEEPQAQEEQTPKEQNKSFIGISAGMGNVDVKQTGSLELDIDLKDDALDYGIEYGYNFNNHLFSTINYQYTSLEDFYLHNLYLTLDYRITRAFYMSPYIGIIGGVNSMGWTNTPLNSIKSIDPTFSYLVGGQVGTDVDLGDSFALYFVYKYWIMDYKTSVSTSDGSKDIDMTSEQNLNFGVKYKF